MLNGQRHLKKLFSTGLAHLKCYFGIPQLDFEVQAPAGASGVPSPSTFWRTSVLPACRVSELKWEKKLYMIVFLL